MKHPEWADAPHYASMEGRVRNSQQLDQDLSLWTRQFDRYVLARRLQEGGVCAGVVQNSRDRLNWDPQLAHRGTYAIFEHGEVGPRRHETVGAKLSKHPYRSKRGAPALGEDNDYVFQQVLGLSGAEVNALVEANVIRNLKAG
jgi:crotonobetainyl-CoA:carnitine CoA-transferase CaiB-like acyl-CoA transferase